MSLLGGDGVVPGRYDLFEESLLFSGFNLSLVHPFPLPISPRSQPCQPLSARLPLTPASPTTTTTTTTPLRPLLSFPVAVALTRVCQSRRGSSPSGLKKRASPPSLLPSPHCQSVAHSLSLSATCSLARSPSACLHATTDGLYSDGS